MLYCLVLTVDLLAADPALETEATNPFTGDPAAVTAGKQIFESVCAAECHPPADGWKGGKYPDLFDCEWKYGGADHEVFHTAMEGVPKTEMVGWKGRLPDEMIWKVIAYLRSASQCETGQVDSAPAH